MKIELLDYTVRASLSNRTLAADMREYKPFVHGLAASGIEHVELGYLAKDKGNWLCKPLATSMEEYRILAERQNITYSVMLHPSGYNCGELPFCAGRPDGGFGRYFAGNRLCFRKFVYGMHGGSTEC